MSDTTPQSVPDPIDDDFDWEDALSQFFAPSDEEPEADTADGDSAAADADEDAPSGDDGGEGDEGLPGGEVVPPGHAAGDPIDLGNGVVLDRDEVLRLANLRDWMQQSPEQVEQFVGYLSGQYDLVDRAQQQPEPEPERILPEVDPDDLTYLPESVRARLQALDEIERRFLEQERLLNETRQGFEQTQQSQAAATAAATYTQAVTVGLERWRSEHPELNDEDVLTIRQEAAQLGIASRLAEQTGDPVRAVAESLEIAYLRNPTFRQRELDAIQARLDEEAKRQRKSSAIAGSSGSAPRTTRAPSTPDERFAAMVEEIRAAQGGTP